METNARDNVLSLLRRRGYTQAPVDFKLCPALERRLRDERGVEMDFAKIHAQYGDRLSFHGTLGTQTTMPYGSVEDVKKTVRANLTVAGSRGGLFCAPSHRLQPEVPTEVSFHKREQDLSAALRCRHGARAAFDQHGLCTNLNGYSLCVDVSLGQQPGGGSRMALVVGETRE
jgi:hypothetical protein